MNLAAVSGGKVVDAFTATHEVLAKRIGMGSTDASVMQSTVVCEGEYARRAWTARWIMLLVEHLNVLSLTSDAPLGAWSVVYGCRVPGSTKGSRWRY